ncbi:MAG TPA: NAD(P)/FAD-dependent oxidoreductase [Flavisolibacter sp.]|jgi:thioredoxin reductase|nr:NAD(P)/FAD-dependent oxidoreductase [Flavisolibacter sp.]
MDIQDCIIVGGGPAGLNAAVVLGRCRRKVLLFDTATYRNRYSHGMHNYLTRDDILPTEFLNISLQETKKYGVDVIRKKIINARKNNNGLFVVKDEEDKLYYAKKLLIATGLSDNLPSIPGFKELYGKSVHHCPYCDGWEVRDKQLGVYARNKSGYELALALKGWSDTVTYYADGKNKLKPAEVEVLTANNISIISYPIERLQADGDFLKEIIFKNGGSHECDALFFVNGFEQQCNLAETFGCNMTKKGVVLTNRFQQTNIEGLYVAGDASKDMHFVVVAAAEGAKAAVLINKELQAEVTIQPAAEAVIS